MAYALLSTESVNSRPWYPVAQEHGRPLISSPMQITLGLAAFGAGVILLFSMAVSLLLDTSTQAQPSSVLNSSFAARTDTSDPYASRPEMTIKPLRASVIPAAAP